MRYKSFILVNLQKAYYFSLTLLKLLKTNSMKNTEKQENVYFYLGAKQESKERTAGSPRRVQPLAHPGCQQQSRHNALSCLKSPGFFSGPQPCLGNTFHCHHSPTGTLISQPSPGPYSCRVPGGGHLSISLV